MKKDIRLVTKINTLNDYIDVMKNQVQKIETVYNLNIYDKVISDEFAILAMNVLSERIEESNDFFQTHLKELTELIKGLGKSDEI